jgi:hypothetical protein
VIFCSDAQMSKHHPSGQRELSVWTFLCVEKLRTVSSYIHPGVSATRLDPVQCFFPAMGFLSKTQIWEDSYNRQDDVSSHPDAILDKASGAYKVQSSECQSSLFGRSSFIYGNCVHQFNRLDVSLHGPDTPSLDMEIECSHHPDARVTPSGRGSFRERISANLES